MTSREALDAWLTDVDALLAGQAELDTAALRMPTEPRPLADHQPQDDKDQSCD